MYDTQLIVMSSLGGEACTMYWCLMRDQAFVPLKRVESTQEMLIGSLGEGIIKAMDTTRGASKLK